MCETRAAADLLVVDGNLLQDIAPLAASHGAGIAAIMKGWEIRQTVTRD
jgi:hypothetical protein